MEDNGVRPAGRRAANKDKERPSLDASLMRTVAPKPGPITIASFGKPTAPSP